MGKKPERANALEVGNMIKHVVHSVLHLAVRACNPAFPTFLTASKFSYGNYILDIEICQVKFSKKIIFF
jgi:hypothetical protein